MTKLLPFMLVLSLFVSSATAHGYITNFWNPTKQMYGDCIRPYVVYHENQPITDRYSDEMTCGHLPGAATFPNRTCSVAKAGDKVALQWSLMDRSHVGPVLVYIASTESKGEGEAWWKIYYDGYDAETDYWATSKLWDNGGTLWISLPDYLPVGEYIIRGEIIALHNASYINGAQIYVNCIHINIDEASESKAIDINTIPKVAFPGYYTYDTPGLHLNVWWPPPIGYPEVGPPIFTSSTASLATTNAIPSSSGETSDFSDANPVVQPSRTLITIAYQATSPWVFYESVASTALLVSVTATASSKLQIATVAAVFPDLTCSTTSTLPTATIPALASTASAVSSTRHTEVFPDLTCSTSSMFSAAATTFLTAVTTQTTSLHTRTLTVTLDPVTVHAIVTVSVYMTEYVTNTVTVEDINIAY
ncbi:glycosyl hydrolase family 61-domain-containing protein [Lipomyces chichibuensis]|uniref:glycosyl hydrolase family 61-domain-containing protein n=1 Tax=Lipomyces chichibuensis TaxID=1546026 RepID=UPI0033437056